MRLALPWIATAIGAHVRTALPNVEIEAFGVDSRTLAPGTLFFALRGESGRDGHDFAAAASKRGAAALVVERPVEAPAPQLLVPDTLDALQQLASAARGAWGEPPGHTIIGVTGSAGKTTTKDAIAATLSAAFPTGKTSGNFNNHLGVPLSLLHLPDAARAGVIELGMNHAGEIRRLAAIARPHIGVVTIVGTAHIEAFDSIEDIALAKRELVEALPAAGVAVLNADDPRVRAFAEVHPGRSLLYGLAEDAEVAATAVDYLEDGVRFRVRDVEFVCPLPGPAGVRTALAALACGLEFDLPLEAMREAVASLEAPHMRGQRLRHAGMTIWNDCYNSSPEAAKMMLDVLVAAPARRHLAVLGEMRELGRWSEDLHRDVGLHAARCGISVLVGIRGAAGHLVRAARDAGLAACAASFFDEPEAAGAWLKSVAQPGDAILFKGSRGTRVELALEEFLK
jgi:UDP-N-acetylmuramoyl-tripeptide--D-alanyl-D-alanine ligase